MKSILERYIYPTERGSWVVRIPGHHSQSFSYKKYNGKSEALKIARQWRDGECGKIGRAVNVHSPKFGKCHVGAKGYYLVRAKKTGRSCWRAAFMRDGKKITKSFSVNKYGFDEAHKLAKQQRDFWVTGVLVPIEYIKV